MVVVHIRFETRDLLENRTGLTGLFDQLTANGLVQFRDSGSPDAQLGTDRRETL